MQFTNLGGEESLWLLAKESFEFQICKKNSKHIIEISPRILAEQQVVQVVEEEVQPLNLEVAVEEVQVLQVEEVLQVLLVEEELHVHCLLVQVPVSLPKIFEA